MYAVDLTDPIVIFRDVETVIKAPLNKIPKVQKAIDDAHNRLLNTFTQMFPGKLVISFNTSAVYSKIVDLVALDTETRTVSGGTVRKSAVRCGRSQHGNESAAHREVFPKRPVRLYRGRIGKLSISKESGTDAEIL